MKKKILIFILTIGIFIITVITIITSVQNQRLLLERGLEENDGFATALSHHLDNYIEDAINVAKTLASSSVMKDALIERNSQLESLSEDDRNVLT